MKKRLIPALLAAILVPAMASAAVVVDDSFTDGDRAMTGALDANWWTSTSSTAIEIAAGSLGLVSGSSGRGIHGTFAAQSLVNVGDSLTATFTFLTPATVGTNKSAALRAGLFNSAGSSGSLAADLSASSGTPNALYNNVTGYMMDLDVNLTGASVGTENISFRERSAPTSGQLMASTGDFTLLTGGGDPYSIAATTTYTGVFTVTKTGAGTVDLTGSLYGGATQLSTWTASDDSGIVSSFDVLAFQVGSSTFGSSGTPGDANNGIDFTNIKINYVAAPVPEPASVAMMLGGLLMVGTMVRRRRSSK